MQYQTPLSLHKKIWTSKEVGNHDKESKEDDHNQEREQKQEEEDSGEITMTTTNHVF